MNRSPSGSQSTPTPLPQLSFTPETDREKEIFHLVEILQEELKAERNINSKWEGKFQQLKHDQERMSVLAEQEEEHHINNMIKYANKLKKEKEDLALQIEREEEYLTNTLQQKLSQLRKEKIDLENQLEQEAEYIVNKLQKQLSDLLHDKSELERKLEQETHSHQHRIEQIERELAALKEKNQKENN